MAQEADMMISAHLHIQIPDGIDPAAAMMEVTKQVEQTLLRAASQQALDTNGILVQVGKVIGAGIPSQ